MAGLGGRWAWLVGVRPHGAGGSEPYHGLLIPEAGSHVIQDAAALGEAPGREMKAPVLICELDVERVDAIEWLRGAGWTEERRLRFWRLNLASNADRIRILREEAQRKLEGRGIAIATVAELGGETFLRRLHLVGQGASADIPGSYEYVPEPYEEWVVWLQSPSVHLDRLWVATLGGDPIGYSFLAYRPSVVETGFTGVLREHRGKGVARALKLETLVQAIELGVTTVETDNDSENAPILHLNEALGYAEIPGKIAFHRKLSR